MQSPSKILKRARQKIADLEAEIAIHVPEVKYTVMFLDAFAGGMRVAHTIPYYWIGRDMKLGEELGKAVERKGYKIKGEFGEKALITSETYTLVAALSGYLLGAMSILPLYVQSYQRIGEWTPVIPVATNVVAAGVRAYQAIRDQLQQ